MKKSLLLSALSVALLTACGGQNTGAILAPVIGAAVGGVVGHQVNDDYGRYVGAAAGALAGAAINNYMDSQQQALAQQVAGQNVGVSRVDESTIQLNIQSEVLFDVNRADIKAGFHPTLMQIANVLRQYPDTVVHVYGFTDGSGNDAHNQRLSEQRANAAAQFLVQQGVSAQRFVVRGYGEQFARAQNNAADRRVEVFIRAINQQNPQAAYQPIY